MSKIFDALRKISGETSASSAESAPRPVPPTAVPAPAGQLPASPEPAPQVSAVPEVPEQAPVPIRETHPVPAIARKPEYGTSDDIAPLRQEFSRELAGLRASVEQILPDHAQKTILIAGSVPGEGASTVAARFAQLLGEDPRLRVALVDADLRNADPRPVEPVETGLGFASVLAGTLSAVDALRPTAVAGLEVLPSEGTANDPYSLCSADHVNPFLNYLRGQYHYALLDAAPVLAAPETALFAAAVDGVVLVVHAGRTKREVVQQSRVKIEKNGGRVLGVVMNRQQYVIPSFIYRRL